MSVANISARHKALLMLSRYDPNETVADLYDDDESFSNALHDLMPGLEYPNISHLSVGQILRLFGGSGWLH